MIPVVGLSRIAVSARIKGYFAFAVVGEIKFTGTLTSFAILFIFQGILPLYLFEQPPISHIVSKQLGNYLCPSVIDFVFPSNA